MFSTIFPLLPVTSECNNDFMVVGATKVELSSSEPPLANSLVRSEDNSSPGGTNEDETVNTEIM